MPTLGEAASLPACLASLSAADDVSVADDVSAADSGSTDTMAAFAQERGRIVAAFESMRNGSAPGKVARTGADSGVAVKAEECGSNITLLHHAASSRS